MTKPTIDADVSQMELRAAQQEIMRLRSGIRLHRDERGCFRFRLDDDRLYHLLPEQQSADTTLPPREEFLCNCEKYYELRQRSVAATPPA